MHIVDSQVHIWGADTPERPWPPGWAHEVQKPYPISKETLLFQNGLAGVRRMVLVPPAVAQGRGSRVGHGPWYLRVARLAPVKQAARS